MSDFSVNQPNSMPASAFTLRRRVGVIGGGQLAWMMADAAKVLNLDLIVQTPNDRDPAVAIAAQTILAPIADAKATAQLAASCDVITFENEFVDLEALRQLAQQGVCFRPSLDALNPLLDKFHQRSLLKQLGLPTPAFAAVTAEEIATNSFQAFPFVLKTRRHGYDGQGTFILHSLDDLAAILPRLQHVPLLLEEFVPFEQELAVMAARSVDGEVVIYPVVETEQKNQVCRWAIAPAEVSDSVVNQINAIAETILTSLDVVGIVGIELFLTPSGTVLVNEIAPRTHNSGHFTLDACQTSQFEQQLRAVCGVALGNSAMISDGAFMVNLLGYEQSHSDYVEKRHQLASLPGAHVHWYGKAESRPGRKLGHVTVLLEHQPNQTIRQQAIAQLQTIESIWYGA
ncbi:MAG: 5-(carboxyamino)imidazole ribonucleotide synthase [Oscillatoriales cyanobacterium C42_A2020_001]|nr:5-(carboxyamino)imidazole ribonucleotide synthase [Leptolyngbyaceae cyanobacterium C42_A2020_001]